MGVELIFPGYAFVFFLCDITPNSLLFGENEISLLYYCR